MVKAFSPRDWSLPSGTSERDLDSRRLGEGPRARHTFGVLQNVATFAQRGVPAIELFHRAT